MHIVLFLYEHHQKKLYWEIHTLYEEICALLGYHAAYSVNSLLIFWDNLSVPSSQGLIGLEMLVRSYHHTLRNIPEECISHSHRGRNLKLHYMKFGY